MNDALGSVVERCLRRLLRPLVRVLLRYGVAFEAFVEIAKQVYVDVAMTDYRLPGRKSTISRASVLTGLSRKQVQRVRDAPREEDPLQERRYNRAARVLTAWMREPEFVDAAGDSRDLPIEGENGSFAALVRRHSGDMPVRAVLDELRRVGAVEVSPDGTVRLCDPGYVPSGDVSAKLEILGTDVADLIHTIEHNLDAPRDESRLQLKVAYDNLPAEAVTGFRAEAAQASRELLERFDRDLSRADRDLNPDAPGTGRRRAGVAIYYFEQELPDAPAEETT